MPDLFSFFIIIFTAFIEPLNSFKTVTVTEQNRDVPSWTSYKYLEQSSKDLIIREYILQEQDQRTYLMCPKGYSIGQIALSLLLGKDQLENNEYMRHKTAAYKYKFSNEVSSNNGDRELEAEDLIPEDLCPTLRDKL